RLDAELVPSHEDQHAALRTCLLEGEYHEVLDDLLQDDLARNRLGCSYRCREIQPLDGRLDPGTRIREGLLAKRHIQLLELPYLAIRSPPQVAVSSIPQAPVRGLLEATHPVEPRGELVRNSLVVDEAVCTGRMAGLFVQAHRVSIATFDAGNFGTNKRHAVFEILRTLLRPHFELPMVTAHRLKMFSLLIR